jgi:hypothetical protein
MWDRRIVNQQQGERNDGRTVVPPDRDFVSGQDFQNSR